jgi:hypothetical protein
MFKRLAKFWHLEPRQLGPLWLMAVHANDNQPDRRPPSGQRRYPQPALACCWSLVNEARLECRWKVECFDQRGQPSSAWTGKEFDRRRI